VQDVILFGGREREELQCYGMEINVETTKEMRISRQPSPVQIMIDKKHVENVVHFSYLGTMITNDARCTCAITARTVKTNAAFNNFLTSKLDLNLREKLVKC